MMAGFVRRQTAMCVALSLGAVMPAFAQTAADQAAAARQADVLQRQQQQLIQRDIESVLPAERAPSGIDTRQLAPKVDASAAGTKCHEISVIQISGSPIMKPDDKAEIQKNFGGRCLGVSEIEQILAEVTRNYMARGYVTTRAYLPQQDLSKGTLEILVLEGVVDKIMLEDGGKKSIHLATVFPRPGEVLNLRDLEQGVEQVNKLGSNNATMDIQPGDKAGGSNVLIRNQPRTPFHASFSADNQGSEGTGRQQYGATLMSDHLLGLNELLLFTHRRSQPYDKERKYSESDSFLAVVPIGYSTLTLSSSRSEYTSTIVAPSGLDLQFRGTSATDSLKLERVVMRDQSTRLTIGSTLTLKDSRSWLAGQYLAVSSRKLSVLDLDASLTTGMAGGVLSLDMGIAQGLKFGGALRDPDNLPNLAPRAQFQKFKYGIGYSIPFSVANKAFSWTTQLTGQTSNDTLYGSEQMLIGGIYSVRGYVKNVLSGDSGYYVRNELAMRDNFVVGDEAVSMRYFTGFDFGEVRNRVPDVPSGRLSGFTFGFSASWRGATLEVFNTRPIDVPTFYTRESSQTWARLNYAI